MSETNGTSDRDNILNKVRAMLAKADPERGGTQNEIEIFAAKAKEWMDRYNITMLEVMNDAKVQKDLFVSKATNYGVSKLKAWHWSLARAICRIVGTRHYSQGAWGTSEREKKSNGKEKQFRLMKMSFFGLAANVEVACELYDKWCAIIDKMATEATRAYIEELTEEFAEEMEAMGVKQVRHLPYLGERSPQTWRTSWLDGCISGIHTAIYEEERKQEDEERKAQGKRPRSEMTNEEYRQEVREEARKRREARLQLGLAPEGDDAEQAALSTTGALVLFNKKVDEAYTEFSNGFRKINSQASSRSNYDAYGKGQQVGKKIRLNSKELKG